MIDGASPLGAHPLRRHPAPDAARDLRRAGAADGQLPRLRADRRLLAPQANATSLSWLIFNDLRGQNAQLFGSAAATSMLTIIGVIILLTPVLIRTWREFNRKVA